MIGDEVRVARARRKVSRAALADLTGLSAKTIQRIENGERPADVSQMAIICEALEESINRTNGSRRCTRRGLTNASPPPKLKR
ncbi:helix-turn-helix domain-containing protein [Rhodococcus hoagii]|nr:helix-turn-helix domain-containing protein [Prescottella equi]